MITREQLRCAYANKVTLGGVVLVAGGLAKLVGVDNGWLDVEISGSAIYLGACAIYFTQLGEDTLKAYRRTKAHIEEHGFLDETFKTKYEKLYCDRVGVRLAMKDTGIEKVLSA